MSYKKERFKYLFSKYLNQIHKESIELFYGRGTTIKVHHLDYSQSNNHLIMECIVVLGDVINEETLDRSMVDALIQEACNFFFPDLNVMTYIRWDV